MEEPTFNQIQTLKWTHYLLIMSKPMTEASSLVTQAGSSGISEMIILFIVPSMAGTNVRWTNDWRFQHYHTELRRYETGGSIFLYIFRRMKELKHYKSVIEKQIEDAKETFNTPEAVVHAQESSLYPLLIE